MRFVTIAQPRTGTTVFRELLNQNRSIHAYGEAFHPKFFEWGWYSYLLPTVLQESSALLPTNWERHIAPYLNSLFEAKEKAPITAVGIDVKIPQARLIYALPEALKQCGAGVLHLRRKNTLAAIVSYKLAMHRSGGRAHGTQPAKSEPVRLDLNWLKLRIAEFEQQDEMIKCTYRNRPYLELFYEEVIGDVGWRRTCVRLSEFLETEIRGHFAPKLTKQNSSNVAELIVNADEVRQHFPQFFAP